MLCALSSLSFPLHVCKILQLLYFKFQSIKYIEGSCRVWFGQFSFGGRYRAIQNTSSFNHLLNRSSSSCIGHILSDCYCEFLKLFHSKVTGNSLCFLFLFTNFRLKTINSQQIQRLEHLCYFRLEHFFTSQPFIYFLSW